MLWLSINQMNKKRVKLNRQCYLFLGVIVFICYVMVTISLNIAIARRHQPQAILVLGGDPKRDVLAAKLAKQNPHLIIWVSSRSKNENSSQIFSHAGISPQRYFLDHRATDTVTNFTTLVADFQQHQIKHLYLVTSDYHMPRAKAIATIILGSRGIAVTPVTLVITRKRDRGESIGKMLRDIVRSMIWIFSGYTGASRQDVQYK